MTTIRTGRDVDLLTDPVIGGPLHALTGAAASGATTAVHADPECGGAVQCPPASVQSFAVTTVVGCDGCGTTELVYLLGRAWKTVRSFDKELDDRIFLSEGRWDTLRSSYDMSWSYVNGGASSGLRTALNELSPADETWGRYADQVSGLRREQASARVRAALLLPAEPNPARARRRLVIVHSDLQDVWDYSEVFSALDPLAVHCYSGSSYAVFAVTAKQRGKLTKGQRGHRRRAGQPNPGRWFGEIPPQHSHVYDNKALWTIVSGWPAAADGASETSAGSSSQPSRSSPVPPPRADRGSSRHGPVACPAAQPCRPTAKAHGSSELWGCPTSATADVTHVRASTDPCPGTRQVFSVDVTVSGRASSSAPAVLRGMRSRRPAPAPAPHLLPLVGRGQHRAKLR